ncbi:MAG: hypothetical protein AAGH15_28740, partial [Myxococcota bacterium]
MVQRTPTGPRGGRLAQLRRDFGMIAATLRGERPSPTVDRPLRPWPGSEPGLGARKLRVREVLRETPDAVTLRLEDVSGAPITYHPGQFLTLGVRVAG